ncbi:MAG: dockerin type I domain-containing protein [bacterium]
MKRTILFFAAIILFAGKSSFATPQPEFELNLVNPVYQTPTSGYFDVRLIHKNFAVSGDFYYRGGQYCLNVTSDFVANFNFSIDTATYAAAGYENRIPPFYMFNNVTEIGSTINFNGLVIPAAAAPVISRTSGTLIARIRFQNNNPNNYPTCLRDYSLAWKLTGSGFVTKIFAQVDGASTQLTSTQNGFYNGLCYFFTCCISIPNGVMVNIKMIPEGYYTLPTHPNFNVTAELRSITSPYGVVDYNSALYPQDTWNRTFEFFTAPSGQYYIVVKHFNTIETWSKSGGEAVTVGSTTGYDFSSAQSQAFGNNLKPADGVFTIFSGDVDQSGNIDVTDIALTNNDLTNFVTGEIATDVNGDEAVDVSDLLIVYNNSAAFVEKITP